VLSCVGRGLCNWLIARPKELYHVSKYITKPRVCEADKVLTRTVEPHDDDDDDDDATFNRPYIVSAY
jgi:hypothetical protein